MFLADRENPLLKEKISEQDSVIIELKGVIAEAGLLQESLEREAHLCNETVNIQEESINKMSGEIARLESKLFDNENKLNRQKRLKWLFGAGGLITGIILPLVF